MKNFLLKIISILSYVWRIIPFSIRRKIIFFILVLESRVGSPADSLKHLFFIYDDLDDVINERSCAYGRGIHPKQRLMRYNDFFLHNIHNGENVLDIGCYHGETSAYIAKHRPNSKVMGVEIDPVKCNLARATHILANLNFVAADATRDLPPGQWDIIILSNVLEHIENRVEFLKKILNQVRPQKVLIRLPNFEKSWHLPLRKELGIYYFSDPTHYIEPSVSEFQSEANAAGLDIYDLTTTWGEIWAVCKPQ